LFSVGQLAGRQLLGDNGLVVEAFQVHSVLPQRQRKLAKQRNMPQGKREDASDQGTEFP
jgi:hypothetical protein